MPDIAHDITIDMNEQKVYVDGVEFPWLLTEDGPEVAGLGPNDITVVTLPIFTDNLTVIPAKETATATPTGGHAA